jgi:hypothetical protein
MRLANQLLYLVSGDQIDAKNKTTVDIFFVILLTQMSPLFALRLVKAVLADVPPTNLIGVLPSFTKIPCRKELRTNFHKYTFSIF